MRAVSYTVNFRLSTTICEIFGSLNRKLTKPAARAAEEGGVYKNVSVGGALCTAILAGSPERVAVRRTPPTLRQRDAAPCLMTARVDFRARSPRRCAPLLLVKEGQ